MKDSIVEHENLVNWRAKRILFWIAESKKARYNCKDVSFFHFLSSSDTDRTDEGFFSNGIIYC